MKAKVAFNIYDITDWITNNYNANLSQEIKTIRQLNLVS